MVQAFLSQVTKKEVTPAPVARLQEGPGGAGRRHPHPSPGWEALGEFSPVSPSSQSDVSDL